MKWTFFQYGRLSIGALATLLIVGSFFAHSAFSTESAPSFLRGRIVLEAEAHGEAWYIVPESGKRLFLGSPWDAFVRLRAVATPVSHEALAMIPVGAQSHENGSNTPIHDNSKQYLGSLLIQADRPPYDAWYVAPSDGLRYPVRNPREALSLIAYHALGISADDIDKIPQAVLAEDDHPLTRHELQNQSATLSPREVRASVPQETVDLVERILGENKADRALGHSLAILKVRGVPIIMDVIYGRWFVFGSNLDGASFHVDYVNASVGRYIHYEEPLQLSADVDAQLYGMYFFDEAKTAHDPDGVTFLVRDSEGTVSLTLNILLTEHRYPGIFLTALSEEDRDAATGTPFFYDTVSLYALDHARLVRIDGADTETLHVARTRSGDFTVSDTFGTIALDMEGKPYRIPQATIEDGDHVQDTQTGRIRGKEHMPKDEYIYLADDIVTDTDGVYTLPDNARKPVRVEGVSAHSFTPWPESKGRFFTDLQRIYYHDESSLVPIPSLDPASFELLGENGQYSLVKDENDVFAIPMHDAFNEASGALAMERIDHLDPVTVRMLYMDDRFILSKDARGVYVGSTFTRVPDADAASFHVVLTVEGIPFGRDQNAIFYALPRQQTLYRLQGADPRSFQVTAVPSVEPALSGVAYHNSLVYAHDSQWIWLYDDAHNGLTIVKRANSDEPVTQADILTFARMYINLFK